MHDSGIEDLLRRFHPAGPPAGLRERCLTLPAPGGRVWSWVAAAALLLATSLGFHAASARALTAVNIEPSPDAAAYERAALADALGGGPDAERMAALIVASEDLTRAAGPPAGPPVEQR